MTDISENKAHIFVTTITPEQGEKILTYFKSHEFQITSLAHAVFSAKKTGLSCTYYSSGKLVVQGKGMSEFIEFYLEPEVLKTFTHTHQNVFIDTKARIGIDESGKGDFFGPLCIAGVYAGDTEIIKLKDMGVKDSKTLTDKTIEKLARQIKSVCAHHIVKINPEKYNQLYTQFGNLNSLLAWGHATAIEQLVAKTGCRNVIVDQFANERVVINALRKKQINIDLVQRHRAEEDFVVAAASILARATFVESLGYLEKEYGLSIPKGASAKVIQAGIALVKKYDKSILLKTAKVHFKTLDAIISKVSE